MDPTPTPAATAATAPAPAPGGRVRWRVAVAAGWILAAVRQHPLRAIGIAIALGLVTVGTYTLVNHFRFENRLSKARAEADRWHNAPAVSHLSACANMQPDHPQVLLLSSRLARRVGGFTESGRLLDVYSAAYGETEELVHERILHRAASRSEERRVGKECRTRWAPEH